MDHIRREKGYFTAESGKIFLSQKIIEHRNQQKHPISQESVFSIDFLPLASYTNIFNK